MKKYIIISLMGLLIIGFANAVGIHKPVLRFIILSVLSFCSALVLKNISIKFLFLKILYFVSIVLVFFISETIFNFDKSSVIYHLLYISIIIIFYFFGNNIDLKKNRRINILSIFILLVIIISEPFFVPEVLYSSNIVKTNKKEIPDFKLEDLNGNIITKEDFKGKVVFFDFWTTTCGYCIAQFPSIYKAAENFKDNPDVLFYLIDYNGRFDDKEYVKKFVKQRNIKLPVLIDKSSDLSKKMNCFAFPHSFILDKNLKIRFHHVGYSKSSEDAYIKDVTNKIKELLNE